MCTAVKTPKVETAEVETIATPTAADASATKNTKKTVAKTAQNAGRDIKSTSRGDSTEATTTKKKLLGE